MKIDNRPKIIVTPPRLVCGRCGGHGTDDRLGRKLRAGDRPCRDCGGSGFLSEAQRKLLRQAE